MKSILFLVAGSVFLSACASPLFVAPPAPTDELTKPMTFNKYMPPENKTPRATPRTTKPTRPAKPAATPRKPRKTTTPGTPVVYESPCVRNGVKKFEKEHAGRSPTTGELNQIERDCRD